MAKDFTQMDLSSWGTVTDPAETATERQESSPWSEERADIAKRDDLDPNCKHMSIWSKHTCTLCGDCGDFSSERFIARRRHPDTGQDGVDHELMERFKIALPGKVKAKIEITLACGDSGSWYYGRSLDYKDTGSGYSALPKFSDKFVTRYAAYWAAMKDILAWFKQNKAKSEEMKTIRKMLIDTGTTISSDEQHRYEVCEEWRECGYATQCFSPENEDDEDEGPQCLKEVFTEKAKIEAGKTLIELCDACRSARADCQKCCKTCRDTCSLGQRCRWPGV